MFLEAALRLKKIEIYGFKSFADKVSLEFNAGITGIVGPNGCGKSNIADAFRWVLGEQSAKSMRGNKMPDVIFAGTANRKPLNYAEVTITLTDINGELPIEYSEVGVTRRLHRSGESEYFINRHPVRLKDVQSLFLDSGMGKDAYSIFEQGKIDQVINFTPLERRYIFEEAAGILRFLQRKREALRKLEQTDQNLVRVKDIHLEVEKQIVVLEQQAEKAKIFKENKAKLETLDKAVYVAKWDNLYKKCGDAFKKEEEIRKQIGDVNQQLEALNEKLQEAKANLEKSEKALRMRSEDVYRARSEKEIKSRERLSQQERLKELITKEKRWQQELEGIFEKRKFRQQETHQLQTQQKRIEKELCLLEKAAQVQREKVQSMEAESIKLRERQQKAQQELLKLTQIENQFESELKQNNVRLENNRERQSHVQERKDKLSELIKELSTQVKEKKKLLQESSDSIDFQKEKFSSLEEKLQELTTQIQRNQEDLDCAQIEITESKARQKALLHLRNEMEGFSASAKLLLQESANPKSPLYNKLKGLYEYMTPENGFETPLAVIMKPYAQTLAVKTNEDFQEVLSFAQKNQLKDFSIICIENLPKQPKMDAQSFSGISPLSIKVIQNELSKHFLKNTWLADNSAAALQMNSEKQGMDILTLDGMLIDRHGVIFYTAQGENNVFLREAELKGLASKLAEMEIRYRKLGDVLNSLQERKTLILTERVEIDKSIRREEMRLVEINFSLQRCNGDLEKALHEGKQLDSELLNIKSSLESISALLIELEAQRASAKAKLMHEQTLSTSLNQELEKHTEKLRHEQRDFQEKESAYLKVVDENRKLLHALNVLEVKDAESQQLEQRLEEEIQGGRELQLQIKERSTEFEGLLEEVEKSLLEIMKACSEMEKEVSQRKLAIEEIEGKMNAVRNSQKKCDTEQYQIGVLLAQLESSRQSLEGELQERYRLTIDEARALNITIEKTLEQTERQIRLLRQEMDAAGDINMTSIDEFEKHKNRYQFLNQQIDDINLSKQELIQIVTQLDSESRKIFKETFAAICANFKKNFKILFNGGEADLQFTETEDVLEAGIEIIAKPPGKQMRSINLMSGGEKCLTAMALLFAIFEVKPAPFCILDEIDAPLDDSNVERFVNVVKQFIEKCQFIIITHNKRTMAIADVLFGVSMEERGVSKLLSIEFSKQAAPEPILVESN